MSSRTSAAGPDGSPAVMPGHIGHYRVTAEKGGGAFGTVYLAEDSRTGRPVAVRVLPREVTDTAGVAETIRRRARTVIETSVAHPALIGVLEYGNTEDGRVFAVMERAEGRPLSDVLAEPRGIDVAAALQRAIELGGPIETLHNVGLVHAAVRPDNFVVASDDSVKLLDVELAALRDVPALQHLVAEHAPSAYLAPEQIEQQPVSEKTDVYAFGVLLYRMLAGAPLVEPASRDEMLLERVQETPPRLGHRHREIPVSVEVTLAAALDTVPERRPFMQEVLNRIARDTREGTHRWKRFLAPAAGLTAVASIGLLVAWSLQAPRLSAQMEAPPTAADKPLPRVPAAVGVPRPPRMVAPITPPPAPPPRQAAASSPSLPPADARVTPFRPVPPGTLPLPAAPPSLPPRPVSPPLSAAAPTTPDRPAAVPVTPPPPAVSPVAPSHPPVVTPVAGEAAAARPRVEREQTVSELPPVSLSAPPSASIRARDAEEADPRALVDWLLNKRGEQ